VVVAENQAQACDDYRLAVANRRIIDGWVRQESSLLILTGSPGMAQSPRSFFYRRIPLWEGHVRDKLEKLRVGIQAAGNDPEALARSVVRFMGDVGKGFTSSAFGNRLVQEAQEGCSRRCKGKPAFIQELASYLVRGTEPSGSGQAPVPAVRAKAERGKLRRGRDRLLSGTLGSGAVRRV
jgi:hypothetical protein